MKTLLTLVLLSTAAFGAEVSCTTLYHHGDRGLILCHASIDGTVTYTKQEVNRSGAEIVTISPETYAALMEQDTQDQQEHIAQLKAIEAENDKELARIEEAHKALAFRKKKDCVKAGYLWQSGVCRAQ